MFEGQLSGIFVAPRKCGDLESVQRVEAVQGRGLTGDRYFLHEGTYSKKDGPDREVTLIEAEAVEAILQENEIAVAPNECRRNLLTRGVPLNHLVGKEFSVGTVKLRGIRLCEPCGHLEKLTARKGIEKALLHRGGLRAQILQSGTLNVGDAIRPT